MNLTRPLVFFDLETTGSDRMKDRIIEYSFIRMNLDGTLSRIGSYVDPEMPIPATATAIHGIIDEMVADHTPFVFHAELILGFIIGCDLAGFGCLAFDVPMLFNEFHRAGHVWDYSKHHIIDAGTIYKRMVPRTLSAAHLDYCGYELEGAHGAEADADATRRVFLSQLAKHEALPASVEALALFSNYDSPLVDLSGKFKVNEHGEIVFNFSANKGVVAKHDCAFLSWMLTKDFPPDVHAVCRRLLKEANELFEDSPLDLPF